MPVQLTLQVLGNGPTQVDQPGTFVLVVGASGPVGGPLVVTLTLPDGLRFVSGGGPGFPCTAQGQLVTCTNPAGLPGLGPAPSGGPRADASVAVTVVAQSDVSPQALLVASASAPGAEPVQATRPYQLPGTPSPVVPELPGRWLFGSGLALLSGLLVHRHRARARAPRASARAQDQG